MEISKKDTKHMLCGFWGLSVGNLVKVENHFHNMIFQDLGETMQQTGFQEKIINKINAVMESGDKLIDRSS